MFQPVWSILDCNCFVLRTKSPGLDDVAFNNFTPSEQPPPEILDFLRRSLGVVLLDEIQRLNSCWLIKVKPLPRPSSQLDYP